MVKVKDFCGAVFHPAQYQAILINNIEHLEQVPMSKTFNTKKMIASGRLYPELEESFYIYRQVYLGHTSYGILAEISLEDYHNNKIKRHEKTLIRPGLNHQTYIQEHVGPVVVSYRSNEQFRNLILKYTASQPYSEWATVDNRQHSLWKIKSNENEITAKFEKIENLYILDGHHRLEAAHKNYLMSNKTKQSDLWIQAIIYSSEYIIVHPQHRVLQNIPENIEIISKIMQLKDLQVNEILPQANEMVKVNLQLQEYEIILKMFHKFYGINFKRETRNILEKVTTFRLQNQIFHGLLSDEVIKKLKYVPGITSLEQIYSNQIVFFVRQPQIETLFEIADQQATMPPKSTWIQPKPCSHMVIRLVN